MPPRTIETARDPRKLIYIFKRLGFNVKHDGKTVAFTENNKLAYD